MKDDTQLRRTPVVDYIDGLNLEGSDVFDIRFI